MSGQESSFGSYIRRRSEEWRTPQEILARFIAGPDDLERVIEGLSESDLDLARGPEKWTIRQIVHHVVHGDDVVSMFIKAALGSSGSTFEMPWYDHQAWVETLDFAGRAIGPGLAQLRANRGWVAQLAGHFPDAWERHVLLSRPGDPGQRTYTVGTGVLILACHIPWHVVQIRETMSIHGVSTDHKP